MRLLFFGSGSPASVIALESLPREVQVAGVVVPRTAKRVDPAAPLLEVAARRQLRVFDFDSRRQQMLADDLSREGVQPELICVATFPSILGREILNLAPAGGINVHSSLLPKHRGPDPLFWTYMNDDRTTGVTVHWLNGRADAGDIILQRAIPLARGRPVVDVYFELARIGGSLLADAIRLIEAGRAPRHLQDQRSATQEPARERSTWSVETAAWPCERVWHVVRGLTIGSGSLLRDQRGHPLRHGPARDYAVGPHSHTAGTIDRMPHGWRVYCVDGYVDVDRDQGRRSWLARVVERLRQLGRR